MSKQSGASLSVVEEDRGRRNTAIFDAPDKIEAEVEQSPQIRHRLEFCRNSENGIAQ